MCLQKYTQLELFIKSNNSEERIDMDFCCWFFDIGKQYFFKNQLKKSKIHQAMFCGKFSSYNYRIFCTIFTHGNNIYFHHNTRAIHKFSLVVTTTDLLTHNNTLFT